VKLGAAGSALYQARIITGRKKEGLEAARFRLLELNAEAMLAV